MSLLKAIYYFFTVWLMSRLLRSRLNLRTLKPQKTLSGVFARQSGSYYIVLRFYSDGLVLNASIRTENLLEAWSQINQWFHRHSELNDLSQGRYMLYDGYLTFESNSGMGKVLYQGVYTGQDLMLSSRSLINGYRSSQEFYEYIAIDESSLTGVYAYTSGQRNHVFRFYPDGTVIQATIFSPDLVGGWERIKVWFHPSSPHLVVRKGRYSIHQGKLDFILGWTARQTNSGTRYSGIILDDSLVLESYISDRISAKQEYRRVEVGVDE